MTAPFVRLESYAPAGRSFAFSQCVEEVSAHTPGEVLSALQSVEAAVRGGLHAAGFISYEAAPALNADLRVQDSRQVPLLWFGLFKERHAIEAGAYAREAAFSLSSWQPSLREAAYRSAIEKIRAHIAAGDTYQVNFTFRLRSTLRGDDLALYHQMCKNQRAGYCAYLDLGRFRVLSASPELFFQWENGQITTRPMKGTGRRGRTTEEDRQSMALLHDSEKDAAENLMIVDLLRNDLGRISAPGSVQVARLFEIERYPTVLQMTSTITARPLAHFGLTDILQALFPCGSVTGAPKIRTMEIISGLEDSPRHVYTGSIGFVSPGPEAVFNVAIRTLLIDTHSGAAELGVGSGITYDSSAVDEYQECLLKASFLTQPQPDFALLESLLYEAGSGYFLLSRHLARLADSADYFGFAFDGESVAKAAQDAALDMNVGCYKVRLLLHRDGRIEVEKVKLTSGSTASNVSVAIASAPVKSDNVFLFHKTTHRAIYTSRAALRPDCDDVLLINERGELTESTVANLVVRLQGQNYTPPVSSGPLAGTFRAELLEQGMLAERILHPEDLRRAEAIFLINSVRRWMRVRLVD